jgi:anti-sigma regulatory factor (Ser/Thr protein kinase)
VLEIVVENRGLGLVEAPAQAPRGLGLGLGAIRRAMDSVDTTAREGGGTRLVARLALGATRYGAGG